MDFMNELEAARRGATLLVQAAGGIFALPTPATSLLPTGLRDAADDVLRARDEDEFVDALDRALSMPDLIQLLLAVPKHLERNSASEIAMFRHVLGDGAGEIAAVGRRRLDILLDFSAKLVAKNAQAISVRSDLSSASTLSHSRSVMDLVCADIPVEFSEAILALGRAVVCRFVIMRVDERAHTAPAHLQRPIAETFAKGFYPSLCVLASLAPLPEDVVPHSDIVNPSDTVRRWVATIHNYNALAERSLSSGEWMCGGAEDRTAEPEKAPRD